MGLFGRKKKDKAAANGAGSAGTSPSETARIPQPVIRIVGDTKHITTVVLDAEGNGMTKTEVVKLTSEELQQLDRANPSAAAAIQKTAPAAVSPPIVQDIPCGDPSLATIEVTRELVKGFIAEIWNRGQVDLIERICHPNLRFNGHVGMDLVGHEGFAKMVTTVRGALTDYHCEIHSMVVEKNKAFCRLKFTGKHTGTLLGYPPTGKPVAWVGASEFTCKNGKILKVWELGDVKSLEAQLQPALTML